MLIPKKNRHAIYEALFKDGVLVAIKDFNSPKHCELEKIRNLEVIKAMQSLKSRGYVRENFAWRHYYWYLTNEGIQYLRDFLHLPPEIVPATLRKSTKATESAKPWGKGGDQRSSGPRTGDADRENYRRDASTAEKGGAGSDFKPEFRAGFGIGRGFGAPSS